MFKNGQNCVPEPIAILGTVSDSLLTLDRKEVTFILLTSFYFSETRVTSNTVADKISPHPKPAQALQRSGIQPFQHLTDFDKPISG